MPKAWINLSDFPGICSIYCHMTLLGQCRNMKQDGNRVPPNPGFLISFLTGRLMGGPMPSLTLGRGRFVGGSLKNCHGTYDPSAEGFLS